MVNERQTRRNRVFRQQDRAEGVRRQQEEQQQQRRLDEQLRETRRQLTASLDQVARYHTEVSHLGRGLANYAISLSSINNRYQELQRDFEESLVEIENLRGRYNRVVERMRTVEIASDLQVRSLQEELYDLYFRFEFLYRQLQEKSLEYNFHYINPYNSFR